MPLNGVYKMTTLYECVHTASIQNNVLTPFKLRYCVTNATHIKLDNVIDEITRHRLIVNVINDHFLTRIYTLISTITTVHNVRHCKILCISKNNFTAISHNLNVKPETQKIKLLHI